MKHGLTSFGISGIKMKNIVNIVNRLPADCYPLDGDAMR